ncbi:MAG: hypothetical protein HY314_02185 [Acidobacteria bacterium]|nr:hypothetical protein [Acidobacteriota bacterium]
MMKALDALADQISALSDGEKAELLRKITVREYHEGLERLREVIEARLVREGKHSQTEEEVWAEMRRIREETAVGSFPDALSASLRQETTQE